MRLYLDEDLAGRELVARLTSAGHDLVPPNRGALDLSAWLHAQAEQSTVVTQNGRDFKPLADETPGHWGLLVVYRDNDPSRDMPPAEVAAAIDRVAVAMPDGVQGMVLSLNAFR